MNTSKTIEYIKSWLLEYHKNSKTKGFIVGVSGGIDSALTSTLCAETGVSTIVLEMPIHQEKTQASRGRKHIEWLKKNYPNVSSFEVNLTTSFDALEKNLTETSTTEDGELLFLTLANTRARLRMITLYYYAGIHRSLVVGTGNKVEDFGVGFYTKYGDGGVDISPIADLMKSEVFALAAELGVVEDILKAKPTDGLWGDDRTDEDQLGASYDELEWAMEYDSKKEPEGSLSGRQKEVLKIFERLNKANQHKMNPIPVCEIPDFQ